MERSLYSICSRAKKLNIDRGWRRKEHFTEEDDEIIKKYYIIEKDEIVKRLPNHSPDSIKNRAFRIGVNTKKWSDKEIEILNSLYKDNLDECISEIQKLNPRRNKANIISKANSLGLMRTDYWTKEEDDIIKKYYPQEGKDVANRLDRRSDKAVQVRASFLKVKYLKTLPKRVLCIETGMIYESVPSATRLTGIKGVKNVVGKDNYTAGGYHWKYVEEEI